MPFTRIDNIDVEYRVKKSRKNRHVYLKFRDDILEIVIPEGMEEWKFLLQKNSAWIKKSYDAAKRREKVLGIGGFYYDGIYYETPFETADGFEKRTGWLTERSREHIASVIDDYAEIIGVKPGGFEVSVCRCWGSCSSKGFLRFNSRIACLPENLRNYVVIHELAHLRHFNHSREFWQEVEGVCPNYREIRKILKTFVP